MMRYIAGAFVAGAVAVTPASFRRHTEMVLHECPALVSADQSITAERLMAENCNVAVVTRISDTRIGLLWSIVNDVEEVTPVPVHESRVTAIKECAVFTTNSSTYAVVGTFWSQAGECSPELPANTLHVTVSMGVTRQVCHVVDMPYCTELKKLTREQKYRISKLMAGAAQEKTAAYLKGLWHKVLADLQ